jgi:hypothetical protein
MTATFAIHESNGTGPTTAVATNINFGSSDGPNLVVASWPVNSGSNSYTKWERLRFSPTFNKIENLKLYKSAGAYVTDETIKTNLTTGTYTQASFTQPTQTTSTQATIDVPTSEPATANLGFAGSLTGSLIAEGYSDYWVMQTVSTSSTPAGDANQKTFTIKYQES